MPLNYAHPDYTKKGFRWRKNRDAFEGEDAVKEGGRIYLIAPSGFHDNSDDYKRYLQRAKWFGGTAQATEILGDAVFAKDPILTSSTKVEEHAKNITLTGIPLNSMARIIVSDILLIGRYGVLLDYNDDNGRPYWSGYPAECIVDWDTTEINGETRLSFLKLKEIECYRVSMFETKDIERYRICYLDDSGYAQAEVREYDNNVDDGRIVDSYTFLRREQPLDFIPFQFFGARDLTPSVWRGPLDALVDVNYGYYRHSADYEHGLFLTALPTPVITGHHQEEPVPIGSLAAWMIPNEAARAYFLEYQGQGLQSHERAMENDKREMATLGARMLENQPETQETLGAVLMRHSGEQGSLKSIAKNVADGVSFLLRWQDASRASRCGCSRRGGRRSAARSPRRGAG